MKELSSIFFLLVGCSASSEPIVHDGQDSGCDDAFTMEDAETSSSRANESTTSDASSGGGNNTNPPTQGCCKWYNKTCVQPCVR